MNTSTPSAAARLAAQPGTWKTTTNSAEHDAQRERGERRPSRARRHDAAVAVLGEVQRRGHRDRAERQVDRAGAQGQPGADGEQAERGAGDQQRAPARAA